MVRDINGLGGYSAPQPKAEQSGKKATETPAAGNSNSPESNVSSDEVQLSSEALSLQSLADKVNNLPDVNVERAEKIKAALENGEYQVDDLVLADKLLNAEGLFN